MLHLAQRRGALGLRVADADDEEADEAAKDDGKVKHAIGEVRAKMQDRKARTFGEFIAMVRTDADRVTPITSADKRPKDKRKGPREWRQAVRNKAASYEHCADRKMIRDEFAKLWQQQKELGGEVAPLLTEKLRPALDNEHGDAIWRHKGLLFGQRRATWDLGTLGRCVLHPDERCVPHADMYASHYRVVETVNNLRIIERGQTARPLTREEREKIKSYLSGPLGKETRGKRKGQPKRTVSVTDLRNLMGWGRASKTSPFHFNIESDEDRAINTDWFSREIIHGAVTPEKWNALPERTREGLNRAILRFDPDHEEDAQKLKQGVMDWAGLSEPQADALIAAWTTRPKPDAKRLNMSRRAVRNLLTLMDRSEPWEDAQSPTDYLWLTQIEARKLLAGDGDFVDVTSGEAFDQHTRRRYATGAKGSTARDRHYLKKHLLQKNGEPVYDPDGLPLHEPPPAPLISNPVVRKAIHEVRRHLIEYMKAFGRKPDEIYIELAREARMGKQDADRVLFRNRLRNRIRNDIIREYGLESRTATQQRAAVDRVVLCVQQAGVCPLCGQAGLTPMMAAQGDNCEVAHIIPRASGGHNGLSNIVLSHTRCNREMGRRTPRKYWSAGAGFDEGLTWTAGIYGDVKRPKPSETKTATGEALWACYFTKRDDIAKIEQFKKDIEDIQQMTPRQEAATKYASRQIMAYISDALYDGKGLPERSVRSGDESEKRRIFATDGLWTSRLRREWQLFFDPHEARSHGLEVTERQQRKEKDRGDHRHHAIDAVIIALCTRQVQIAWEEREKQADRDGINTADQEAMDNYRRQHPLAPPAPFKSDEEFREAVKQAVFGNEGTIKPVCHRPVKRKLIGALHEETLFGPVLDRAGNLTEDYTAKKGMLALTPNHLRPPRPEMEKEAVERLAARRMREKDVDERTARKWARAVVGSPAYTPAIVDPPPGKSGIVRDRGLRMRLRTCLEENGLNPDKFTANEIKKLHEAKRIRQASGVPINSMVLLRTMTDPVITSRRGTDYATGDRVKIYDAETGEGNAAAARAYVGGNNHHIEIRVNDKGKWTGKVVTTFDVARPLRERLRSLTALTKPYWHLRRKLATDLGRGLPKEDRRRLRSERARENLAEWKRRMHELKAERSRILLEYPLVDRSDNNDGSFVMSLCEGEMLWMRRKPDKRGQPPGDVGYFVVAKLDKPQSIVVVPHWDARSATERKDAEGSKVPNSEREQFAITPTDLKTLAPPGHEHAVKVRVGPLGDVQVLERD